MANRPRSPIASEQHERLGRLLYHPVVSLGVVGLILLSVSLVFLKLIVLPPEHSAQPWVDRIDLIVSLIFCVELGLKAYVAPDRLRFLSHYWLDILAVVPWFHSLRVLRVLRLLRVFRVALILSRRIRFVSALLRSAVGEYIALGLIMTGLLFLGTFALFLAERSCSAA